MIEWDIYELNYFIHEFHESDSSPDTEGKPLDSP